MTNPVLEPLPADYDEPLSDELEAQIDAAIEAAKYAEPSPVVTKVEYLPEVRAISVHVNTGQRLLIPVEDMQYVSTATPEQLQETEIVGLGDGIGFPAIDAHFLGRWIDRRKIRESQVDGAA